MLWKPPEVSFLGGFFCVCGKGERVGMGRSLCVTTVWDRETQIFPRLEHPRIGAVRVARGWKREKILWDWSQGRSSRMGQRPSWDGDLRHWQENRVWVGTSCSCRDGNLAFAPLLCQGKGAENGQERGEIWREGEAGRSKAQAMGSDNLNSCAEGLSLQAN